MAWQPQADGLRQLSECLKDSLNAHERTKQKEAETMLLQAQNSNDYVDYLTYIYKTPEIGDSLGMNVGTAFLVRYAAAINLKNFIKSYYKLLSKEQVANVKSGTLFTLRDLNPPLRNFAGTIITETIQQGGLLAWPEILQELISLVSNTASDVSGDAQESAMSALSKVCEDNRKLLDKEFNGQRPMSVIVPRLLDFTSHTNPKIRVAALYTLKTLMPVKSPSLFAMMDQYMTRVFQLATDDDKDVRRMICQTLVLLVNSKPELLIPHMDGLVAYILAQQQTSGSPELSLDAAEFWLNVGEQEQLRTLLGPYLDRIIPVLLAGMVYGEDEIFRLGGDEDNADQEDRAEDLKPQFAQSKAGRGAVHEVSAEGTDDATNGEQSKRQDLSDGEVEEDDGSEDEEWDDDDPENAWSLRKCSAAALDVFAVNYGAAVFNVILPYLKENLSHSLWPKREAAVLALGAIAEGCVEVVSPHLPELVPFLIASLSDDEPVVRQITCWCLSRYSEWASHLQNPVDIQRFFEPMMEGLLQRMLDKNKKVQEAGASSFASLEERAGDKLKPYVEPILRQFVLCFQQYKDKNMYVLYDCLQTLAENVGPDMAKPHLVELLMPTLTQRWHKIDDESREMFPLLGCLGYIAMAYGDSFAPFAPPITDRCVKLIMSNLQMHMAFMAGQSVDEPDKDFVVTALDLLSAIVQALDPVRSGRPVVESQPQFYDLLSFCMEDPTEDVRQSAYALLGDCAIAVYSTLEPYLPKLMPILIRQLDLDLIRDEDSEIGFNVLINVCWAAGEISARAGPKLETYLGPVYQGLVEILKNEECPDAVNENAGMSLGRMGLSCPDQLAPRLPEFAEAFLESMSKISTTQEKASAFLGFNRLIERNPQAMEGALRAYFTAIAAFPQKDKEGAAFGEVRKSFGLVMQGYKQMIPDFAGFLASLPPNVQQKLKNGYNP